MTFLLYLVGDIVWIGLFTADMSTWYTIYKRKMRLEKSYKQVLLHLYIGLVLDPIFNAVYVQRNYTTSWEPTQYVFL